VTSRRDFLFPLLALCATGVRAAAPPPRLRAGRLVARPPTPSSEAAGLGLAFGADETRQLASRSGVGFEEEVLTAADELEAEQAIRTLSAAGVHVVVTSLDGPVLAAAERAAASSDFAILAVTAGLWHTAAPASRFEVAAGPAERASGLARFFGSERRRWVIAAPAGEPAFLPAVRRALDAASVEIVATLAAGETVSELAGVARQRTADVMLLLPPARPPVITPDDVTYAMLIPPETPAPVPAGLVWAAEWHADLTAHGADLLNDAFRQRFRRPLDSAAWRGWAAMKAVGQAVASGARTAAEMRAALETLHFDGRKERPLSFEGRRLSQPLYVVGRMHGRGYGAPELLSADQR
jgi:hypothetical protein